MFLRLAKHQRIIASFLLINFLTFFIPIQSKALSSGPSQPETQQFAPAGMDDMVDPFTGDFSYNIPLMDVGGYPINLNYASGITPDAEASWVGLGWNLNVGAINRSVRGLPDDFAGDELTTDFNVAPNETYGTKVSVGIRFFDAKVDKLVRANLGVNANIFYNTYNGIGISAGINPSISSGSGTKNGYTGNLGVSLQAGSESGLDISPTIGISHTEDDGKREQGLNASIGFPFNTREGLKGMTLAAGYSTQVNNDQGGTSSSNFSKSAFQGFSTPTYTPGIQQSHRNFSISTNFALQFSNPASELGNLGFEGYYSGQYLTRTTTHNPAYGYMYSGVGNSDQKLYDINREKDGTYNKKYTQNLPVTNYTYDIFNVSGQGISGTYRLHRGDFGIVADPVAKDESIAPSAGVSLGLGGNSIDVGVNGGYYQTNAVSGKWSGDNSNFPGFNPETNLNNPTKEVVYFKKMGEATVENDAPFLSDVQRSTELLQYNLASSIYGIPTSTYANTAAVKKNNSRTKRPNKTSAFTTLTAAEAAKGAVLPIQNYTMNTFTWTGGKSDADKKLSTPNKTIGYAKDTLLRVDNIKKAHHISEVRVTDQSGARYIYGIPAYNISQQEITFAVDAGNGKNTAINSGLVPYQSSDLGTGNRNGLDNYYNRISTPANAHSYLLTCILSSDYVDSDNIPGPSNGDLGTYTKFNYSKLESNFLWRTPMSESQRIASFSEGMKGDNLDDKGNIIYGEKEVWYLHSIETPTHVAEFYLSKRLDGFGAEGLDGKIGNTALMKLDKIVLYAKADKLNSSAEPIKTVYFSYSYKLCPGTVNSKVDVALNPAKGKLTLDKVWFTYGGSKKGVLNPYVFTYADQDFDGVMDTALNPAYSHLNYDRWGTYKFNNAPNNLENKLSNGVFPYTEQNKNTVDKNAAVYALSTIQMPTAGTMHVVYESDDYAYVQDKKAMRMFTIADESSVLYTSPIDQKNSIKINLGEGFVPKTLSHDQEFRDLYIGDTELMYFKVLLNVINPSVTTHKARTEYVPGYAEIEKGSCVLDAGSLQGNKYTRATIVFKKVKSGGLTVNPIARAGWMFAKLNLSRELKGLDNAKDMGPEAIMFALISQISSVATIFAGYTSEMIAKQHSSIIVPKESYVKLIEPDQIKLGGGHRVKAIIMSDSWALMKSVKETQQAGLTKQTSYYGQTYSYTKTENNRTISSGVAAYEPIVGGDENPFRRPVFVEEKVPLAANNVHFLEEPFGECFFPAPTVGYSKVVVTPVKLSVANIQNKIYTDGNGTGRVEQEFYTAKDFPTYTERTEIIKAGLNPNILSKFMRFASTDLATCTQGYYIETNDMHGKPKSKRVYPEIPANSTEANPQPISEVEYKYKTSGGKLDNQIKTINPDLTIPAATSTLGVDVDVVNDQREFSSATAGGGIGFHLKTIVIVIPLPIPTGFPDVGDEFVQFRSVVTTKVANRYGILEETIAKDNGASISTKNLAWDAKTGEVILTSLQNEFHDPIYTFNYPAHWAYPRMGQASETEGMSFSNTYFDAHPDQFKDGDELIIDHVNKTKAFVNKPDNATMQVIDKNGSPVSFTRAKVVRSGARNMASAPIGTVVTLTNPMQGNTIVFNNVLNAGASEYKETWKRMGCDCKDATKSTNPYITGVKGNLRPYRSWTYLTDRYQRQVNNQMNIRTDGFYKDFAAFWQYKNAISPLGVPDDIGTTKWQYVTEITNYNPLGLEIENKDALSRYLMAQYGYGRKLPVATSNNSQYRESGFDGFEDYGYGDCVDDHFSWRNASTHVTSDEAHTGRKSIKVEAGQKLEIKKVILPCE